MDKQKLKREQLARRQRRVRGKVSGTAERPRLRVTRSNTNIYAQIIDDVAATTLVSASSLDAEFKATGFSGGNIEGATAVGKLVAERALAKQANPAVPELEEQVVVINRVSKTVKGGRRLSLSALVVVGNRNGKVGVGMGKSAEVPLAISKAVEDAKKNMFTVPVTEAGTVPHEVIGEFGAGRVLIKPAVAGTGIIAGGPVRALLELAGIKDVMSKSLGTDNAMNVVKAAAAGLADLTSPEDVAAKRGMDLGKIYGKKVQ